MEYRVIGGKRKWSVRGSTDQAWVKLMKRAIDKTLA
jgi:hypothetical protein